MTEMATTEGVVLPAEKGVVLPAARKSKEILYLYKPQAENAFQSPAPLFLVWIQSENKTKEIVIKQGVHLLAREYWDALVKKESFQRLVETEEIIQVSDSDQLLSEYVKKGGKRIPIKRKVIDYIQSTYKVTLLESWARWVNTQNDDIFETPLLAIKKQIRELKDGKVVLPSFSDDWGLVGASLDDYGDLEG
jgi:hypothetical protein